MPSPQKLAKTTRTNRRILTEREPGRTSENDVKETFRFYIDRGGTFTDVVAISSKGRLHVEKILSSDEALYDDSALEGIRRVLGLKSNAPVPEELIDAVHMGTTIGTNALLERKGEPVVLAVNRGFKDALKIGYQNRPDIFALEIRQPEMLYAQVIEVEGRFSATGKELEPLNPQAARQALKRSFDSGIKSIAIVLMHGDRYPGHEKELATIAREIGFTQISASHEVSPLIKFVGRGDTTIADAYLTPLLIRYLKRLTRELSLSRLYFMQSSGGLTEAERFRGRDCLLSGPAGGIVAAAKTSILSGFEKIVAFDMGGTSTDVSHFAGKFERTTESVIAGVRVRAPMMSIHTVAAGGGSILSFDGERLRVGPESAGADPGPLSYRKGGPLTITDANLHVGRIQPDFFPSVFGSTRNLSIDKNMVDRKFSELAEQINEETGSSKTSHEVAEGFLAIAIEKMAGAVRKISTERGYDLKDYALSSFGGAGGQHACAIADALGITKIIIHPLAGVLSALGMGAADTSVIKQQSIELVLNEENMKAIEAKANELELEALDSLSNSRGGEFITRLSLMVRYEGSDSALAVYMSDFNQVERQFELEHQKRYGFAHQGRKLVVESIQAEALKEKDLPEVSFSRKTVRGNIGQPEKIERLYAGGKWHDVPIFDRDNLARGTTLHGPLIIAERTATTVVDDEWKVEIDRFDCLILEKLHTRKNSLRQPDTISACRPARADPVRLELFNNQLTAIAEEMGVVLQNTSHSVNIKERLDFSCAIFDSAGRLIANAPHIPVHLGSMSESVQSLLKEKGAAIEDGDVYLVNNPFLGGTHLPDITAISPVFLKDRAGPVFFVASRGHHADIGGITPGSMPPASTDIRDEGVVFSHFELVKEGFFRKKELLDALCHTAHPARNPMQNLADLTAQIAANNTGRHALLAWTDRYGINHIESYMRFVRENAASSVRRAVARLRSGSFETRMDDGAVIKVAIKVTHHPEPRVSIDFSGTSPQRQNNMNAPRAITKAAVLYVFRTIVMDNIPLNDGCLEPIEFHAEEGSLLNPRFPAAVVAGNVETSQAIVDALYGALGIMAASQGTMNNFTFGNDRFQYYETICGGAGAGDGFNGSDAVHTHMTNSRLTDPEILELRFPVLLKSFSIRRGSGGGGRFTGGCGTVREIEFLAGMTASILSQRRVEAPFGIKGGRPGLKGKNYLRKRDGSLIKLSGTDTVEVEKGDVFVIETPGGGGFGEI